MDFDLGVKKEFNKLRAEWRYINNELFQVKEIAENAWKEFYPKFLESISGLDVEDPFFKQENSKKKKDNSIFEEDCLKEKYREAARLTHPDKNKESVIDSFKNISKAKKEGNLNQFYDEIKKINIKNVNLSYKELDQIEKEIKEIKNQILNISNSIFFKWYYSDQKNRDIIINLLITNLKNDKKKK